MPLATQAQGDVDLLACLLCLLLYMSHLTILRINDATPTDSGYSRSIVKSPWSNFP